MQLLPVIIITAVLGLFLAIFAVVFAFHCLRARKRRRLPQLMTDNNRPTRQLVVQSGKVVPISQALQTASTRDLRSLDLTTVRSADSLTSRFSQNGVAQPPQATKFRNLRASSGPTDLEAQNKGADTWEANVRELHRLEERLRKSRGHISFQADETERRVSASSQKIAASLKKAYKGTPALATETVDIPPTLGSRSTEIRTIVRKKKSNPSNRISSHPTTSETKIEPMTHQEPRKHKLYPQTASRVSTFDPVEFAVSTNSIQLPPPVLSIDTRTSSHLKRLDNLEHTSFLSMSTSPDSSELSKAGQLRAIDTDLALVEKQETQNISRPTTSDGDTTPRPRLKTGWAHSNGNGISASRRRETSFIDSATASAPNIQRYSIRSRNSIATFASSDLSSTWTFGNAQPIKILPSVVPHATPAPPDLRRLKSKYGRYPIATEKALPITPRSPLST